MDRNIEEWDREATERIDEAEAKLNDFVGKAKASAKGEAQQEPTKTVALEARSEEVRVLYARVLAVQCLVDGRLDPREIEYLYVFMSRVGLGPDSREEVRRSLDVGQQVGSGDLVRLVEEVVAEVPDNEEEIAVSLLKDMTQVSWADGAMVAQEEESIRAVAEARFGERAEQVIELAAKTVEYEKALIKGDITASELEKSVKDIAAVATAAGVPITALFFSGSVVGLSAAGITSGLAALGLGGVLGLSAMVTGIGAVAVLGVAVYAGVKWLLGGRERELAKQRERMIQEVIKRHQGAIEDLAEDVTGIGLKLTEYVSRSDRNEADLERLKGELQMFNAALAELQQEKGSLEAKSVQHAV